MASRKIDPFQRHPSRRHRGVHYRVKEDGSRNGILVEYDSTEKIFTQPADERTEGYVTGRFG